MNLTYLRSKGLGPGACTIAASVSHNFVTRWTKICLASAIKALFYFAYYCPKSDLHGFVEIIKSNFYDSLPYSTCEARKPIFKLMALLILISLNQLITPFRPTLAINRSINKQIPRTKVVASK